jgi:23S rRNA (cytidine1920-2'-O)/16S rRNA (cytidine1409-2'-O)-methyltransferase
MFMRGILKMNKIRIDSLLVERGLVHSRTKAAALIMAGCVLADDVPVEKPSQRVPEDTELRIKGEDHPYVSRGGVKLAKALEVFDCDVAGRICMDVGASTGGFTDCLLKAGAARVYAIDVGYGQLAASISSDKRVVVMDRTNIRKLERSDIPEEVDLAVIDVSFISLRSVLPKVNEFLADGADLIALIKPQFEVGRELVGKGGIVKDPAAHELATNKVKEVGASLGLSCQGVVESPILGAKGNKEFLIHFLKPR